MPPPWFPRLVLSVQFLREAAAGDSGPAAEWYPYTHKTWSTDVENHNYICSGGSEQSPINFPSCSTPMARPPPEITWATQTVTLFNNGHTVQLNVDPDRPGGPGGMSYAIAGLVKEYTLLQCHFHHGSEHTVGGTQFPFEAHCVHVLDASDSGQRYGVFGLFYEEGAESPFLAQFEDHLTLHPGSLHERALSELEGNQEVGYDFSLNLMGTPIVKKGGDRRLANWQNVSTFSEIVDFSLLHSGVDLTKYFNYDGSFTTPPCTEAVDFYIFANYGSLSPGQLAKFMYAIGWTKAGGNFRPPQPIGARTVYGCTLTPAPIEELDWYPYKSNIWASDVGVNSHKVCASGSDQSPINFEECMFAQDRVSVEISWAEQDVDLINNGHTVQLTAKGENPGKMLVEAKNYTLVQCHYHWGSEHTVGGRQFPFEGHCVHSLDVTEEATHYGVFGLFFVLDDEKPSPFLAAFEDHLVHADGHRRLRSGVSSEMPSFDLMGNPLDRITKRKLAVSYPTSDWHGPLDFKSMYGDNPLIHYWGYQGSFTTPPCTEAVDFYIMMDHATMSRSQLLKMKSAIGWKSAGGNFRPPQPVGSRVVAGCARVYSAQDMVEDAVKNTLPLEVQDMVDSSVEKALEVRGAGVGDNAEMLSILLILAIAILTIMVCILGITIREQRKRKIDWRMQGITTSRSASALDGQPIGK